MATISTEQAEKGLAHETNNENHISMHSFLLFPLNHCYDFIPHNNLNMSFLAFYEEEYIYIYIIYIIRYYLFFNNKSP